MPVAPTTPTSSAPAPTTTAPAPVTAQQSLSGRIWLDLDSDGTQDGDEPGLPDVGVRVTTGGTAALLRRTDTTGAFRFADVAVGTARVVATPPAGLTVTADSDGATDAEADVTLPSGGNGSAWVGLAGTGRLSAFVGGGSSTSVLVRWYGPDDVLRTVDDVVLRLRAYDGTVSTAGLPPGTYRVEQVGETRTSSVLQVASDRTTVTEVIPTTRARAALPFTGAPAGAVVLTGLCLVGAGIGIRFAGRRPQPADTGAAERRQPAAFSSASTFWASCGGIGSCRR